MKEMDWTIIEEMYGQALNLVSWMSNCKIQVQAYKHCECRSDTPWYKTFSLSDRHRPCAVLGCWNS